MGKTAKNRKIRLPKNANITEFITMPSFAGNSDVGKITIDGETYYFNGSDTVNTIKNYTSATPQQLNYIPMRVSTNIKHVPSVENKYGTGEYYADGKATIANLGIGTKFTAKDYCPAGDYNDYAYYVGTISGQGEHLYKILAHQVEMAAFLSGGYTGAWGQEGKLAMLHEKELVLNQSDTTNFLASLEVLRDIINTINLHSMNAQIAGLLNTPNNIHTMESQTLEQRVTIEASFPGVTNRNEIEEAFNNLVNRASQYVNRK